MATHPPVGDRDHRVARPRAQGDGLIGVQGVHEVRLPVRVVAIVHVTGLSGSDVGWRQVSVLHSGDVGISDGHSLVSNVHK